ncbi:MAG: helix-hairpin-helix domain-containing protein [Balneolaceae bacterium]|nr:helix-hairpin-helix domain-containing protein [Balneolaceae bacterium]
MALWALLPALPSAAAVPAVAPPVLLQHPPDTVQRIPPDLQGHLEQALGEEETGEAGEVLAEALQRLVENPVNLNTADLWTLLQVPGMNLRLAQAVLDHRARSKPFETVDELDEVSGIGPVTLERFRPFITVGEGPDLRRLLLGSPRYWTAGGRLEMISRYRQVLEPSEGYLRAPGEGGYGGGPVQLYQRLRYAGDHLSAGLLLEKDPGEPLPGVADFDYRSWHLGVHDAGRLRDLVAGDYGLSFGQGLVLWNGGLSRKGAEVVGAPVRTGGGIRPYTSSGEGGAMRGAALTWGGRLQATAFYSSRRHTASARDSTTAGPPQSAGYHRTSTERANRGRLGRQVYGGRLQWHVPGGIMGVTVYGLRYDRAVDPGDAPWQRDRFRGRRHAVAGLDASFSVGPALLFGEAARSANGGWGLAAGVEGRLDAATELSALYRNYDPAFQSPLGGGFGEGSASRNEEGLYLGLSHRPARGVELRGYLDLYRFPAPRFSVRRPSGGREWLARLHYRWGSEDEIYLQLRSSRSLQEYTGEDAAGREVRLPGTAHRATLRLHLQVRAHPAVRLRTRLELSHGRSPGEGPPPRDPDLGPPSPDLSTSRLSDFPTSGLYDFIDLKAGFLLYQDVRVTPAPWLTLDLRYTLFEAPDWENRLYQFENNLLYVLSNQLLYGSGTRWYLLAHLRPAAFLDLWARVGRTVYEDRREVGSGLDRIAGPRRTDLGVQLRLKF